MRIIAGKARGTRLGSLKDLSLRPTLDRVRESLFNILMQELEGARVLDLFAGTGAIGIEALSREASRAVFVEPDPAARRLIRANLEKCRIPESQWTLLEMTAHKAIELLESRGSTFRFIYVDPPFEEDLYEATLQALGASSLVAEDGRVVVEHFRKKDLAPNYGKLTLTDFRRLGDTVLSFYTF